MSDMRLSAESTPVMPENALNSGEQLASESLTLSRQANVVQAAHPAKQLLNLAYKLIPPTYR
jgi:hypothetical protein